jgi:Xaa-Pro aminopeptidase
MKISRRDLFKSATVASGSVFAGTLFRKPNAGRNPELQEPKPALPLAFDSLQPLGDRAKPIRAEEFQGRVARAQQLMSDAKRRFEVLYVTPGTTLLYYTGIQWWPSERVLAFLVPRQGDPLIICPAFEEGRLREQLRWSIEIRVWQEDENPYRIAGKWLAERGIRTGKIGVEETTRIFSTTDCAIQRLPSNIPVAILLPPGAARKRQNMSLI